MLDKYVREAALSQAPLLLGEWGPASPIHLGHCSPVRNANPPRAVHPRAQTAMPRI